MARSSWRRIPFASIAAGLTAGRTRLVSISLRQLDTSHGCQNHTLLPYATTPLVLRGSIAHSFRRPAIPRARNAIASTATRTPRIVTTRTPLFMRRDGDRRPRFGKMRSGLFLTRRLDDPNHVESAGEIRSRAGPSIGFWTTYRGEPLADLPDEAVGCRRAGIDGFHGEATTIQTTLGSQVVPYAGVMLAMF